MHRKINKTLLYNIHVAGDLMISSWVCHNEKTWLTKCLLDLVGEGPWCESACDGVGTSVVGKLQDGTLHGAESTTATDREHFHDPLTWPYCLLDKTQTSVGFSMAAMIRAASKSFSHVLRTLNIGIPGWPKRYNARIQV